MKINTNLLENNVIPKIKKGKNNLEDAYDTLASTSVPSDFGSTYKQKLKKAKTSIENLEDDLSALKTYVSKKCNSFEKVENKNEQLIKSLGKVITSSVTMKVSANNGTATTTSDEMTLEEASFSSGAYITQAEALEVEVSDETSSEALEVEISEETSSEASWEDTVQAYGADVINVVFGVFKGALNFVESVVDVAVIVGALTTAWLPRLAYDVVSGIVTGEWDWSATTSPIKQAMSFVSYDFVEMASDALYGSDFGKWLDENAHFKSDGIVCEGAEMVGEVAATIAAAFLTCGASAGVEGTSIRSNCFGSISNASCSRCYRRFWRRS